MTTAIALLSKEQLDELERAATSLLSDDEILLSLEITEEQLTRHYNVVEKARVKLKQRLNAKKVTDAAKGEVATSDVINNIPRNDIQRSQYRPGRGGARPGSGPKPGSTKKISGASILEAIYQRSGKPFSEMLTDGYVESIERMDHGLRLKYETLILSKVVSDKVEDPSMNGQLRTLTDDQLALAIRVALASQQAQNSPKTSETQGEQA